MTPKNPIPTFLAGAMLALAAIALPGCVTLGTVAAVTAGMTSATVAGCQTASATPGADKDRLARVCGQLGMPPAQ